MEHNDITVQRSEMDQALSAFDPRQAVISLLLTTVFILVVFLFST